MASTGLQLVGFVFGVFSWVGMIATCASPEWRRNNPGEVILHYHISYEGLWTNCKLELTGVTTCDTNASFYIGVPAVVQVCRALMISAIVLGFCAILITIFGIKCTSIGNSNPRAKARAAIVGGILFLIAAILTGVAVSYYAHIKVVQEYHNPAADDPPLHIRYEYGIALLIGWASLVGGILGGSITAVTSIYIITKINSAGKRGRQLTQRGQRGVCFQRQQRLPPTQRPRTGPNPVMRSCINHRVDGKSLTKQRVAQHNAKLNARNGNVHLPHAHVNHQTKEQRSSSHGESSSERKITTATYANPILEKKEGSKQYHSRQIHQKSPEKMSLHKSPERTETKERKRSDVTNGGHTRRRPDNEYV